ncbi:hypothetical protein [Flagellimonas myxillae]|uniref:hypothetical protein n=1 Tax=Flagellimonas myxillae TaxID=2942214 RepID=UPI00201FA81A|nr:hypothetical protein [Muricauda myxillae]MCL6265776.1 hypothetical protein [Muricauda myxillae]
MKYSIITLLISLLTLSGFGQTSSAVGQGTGLLNTVPQEKVFVHTNQSLVFSGEYLMYKIFCLDSQQRKLTHISKIGYVSLVDKNGKAVFTHKVRLENGAGYGDFFVPTSISTGSYKLLGYSQWMENFGTQAFFQSNIHIINPYQPIPEAHLAQIPDSLQQPEAAISNPSSGVNGNTNTRQDGLVQIKLDKTELGVRQPLSLEIITGDDAEKNGNYVLSVRKVDHVSEPEKMSTSEFMKRYMNHGGTPVKNGSASLELPEIRGEVISGTVTHKATGQPAKDVRVSLSLPGNDYLFKVARSNAQGAFRFLFNREYDNVSAALQVLSDNWEDYDIVMDEAATEFSNVEVTEFIVPEGMQDFILQKSIQNQIENGYREVKSDALIPAEHQLPYYRKFSVNYNLDDYTRFNSIQETIVEVVDQMSVRKLENGDRVFEIRPEEGFTDLGLLPMVFVDGLFIKKHEDFMDFSAKKIKSIHFSRNKVILGPQIFQGVLNFKTVDGNFYNEFYTPHIVNLDLFKPQPQKEHFNQTYNSNNLQERVPDFRNQLLWEPNLDLSSGSKEIVLYTSDVTGEYELILEGFSSIGNPVSVKRRFLVK